MSWLVLGAVLFVGVLGAWYLLTNEDKGNTANAHGAISNNISATSDQETSSTFASLIVHYPATWVSQKINGSDSCMGLVSPELKQYNEQWRQQHPEVTSTDAVITNDVTICNAGSLSGELTTFAEKILREEGAAIQSSVQVDQPFAGALTYEVDLPTLHQQIFYKRQETVFRAIRAQLPYDNSGANSKLIDNILRRVEVDSSVNNGYVEYKDSVNRITATIPTSWEHVTASNGRTYFSTASTYLDFHARGLTNTKLPDRYFGVVWYSAAGLVNANMSEQTALRTAWAGEALPLLSEEFLSINGLPAYKVIRQLAKDQKLPSGEKVSSTITDVEYTILKNTVLYRVTLEINGEDTMEIIDEFNKMAATIVIVPK